MMRPIFLAFAVLLGAGDARAVTYQLIDLGVPAGASESYGYGINDAGMIAASAQFGPERAYSWQAGVWTALGNLGGAFSRSYDINASGVVVGSSTNASGVERPFRMNGTTMVDLGSLGGAG